MSLPMRITFESKDYTYKVLTRILNKEINAIKISIEGKELILIKTPENEWDCQERTVGDNYGLIKAIGRNIALRYRL